MATELQINDQDNLVEAFASLPRDGVLVLSRGIYVLDSHLVVDGGYTIKSATGSAKDVTIVRRGSTAILVKGGAPRFENLTFISPASATLEAQDRNDDISYQSCVAVRGGSPVFVECRATSADQSAFSARGTGTTATLLRCQARGAHDGGIFFDEGAVGVLEDCLFADTGLGCVDCEQTPPGQWVEVRKSRLYRGGAGCVNAHNGGRIKLIDCELSALRSDALVVGDSELEAYAAKFRAEELPEEERLELQKRFPNEEFRFIANGCYADNSSIYCEDCSFENFQYAVVLLGDSERRALKNCSIVDCAHSVASQEDCKAPELVDCQLCAPLEVRSPNEETDEEEDEEENDGYNFDEGDGFFDDEEEEEEYEYAEDEDEDEDYDEYSEYAKLNNGESDDDSPLTEDQIKDLWDAKEKFTETFFGPCSPIVRYAPKEASDDGLVDCYLYPDSKYGGTFFVTKESGAPLVKGPVNAQFDSYEFAMATRLTCPPELREDDVDAKPQHKPDDPFYQIFDRATRVMSAFAWYVNDSDKPLDQYHTLEFPDDFADPTLAGARFIVDAIGIPRERSNSSIQELRGVFEKDWTRELEQQKPGAKPAGLDKLSDAPIASGFMLIVELFPEELEQARKHGGFNFIPYLKAAGVWPYSDMDRDPIDMTKYRT